MARVYNTQTLKILAQIAAKPDSTSDSLFSMQEKECSRKDFNNTLFRLCEQDLVSKQAVAGKLRFTITNEGKKILGRNKPERDGIWKIVIFDIPEKQKYVRVVLRAKLKSLHFKKWQNSIWVSPFALDEEVEGELNQLAKKFFVRLIKTTDINYTEDLEKLFK